MHPKVYFQIYDRIIEAKVFSNTIDFCDVEVKEYQPVNVWFEHPDPNAFMLIESYEEDLEIRVQVGERLNIIKEGDSEDMLVPGEYPFKIVASSESYEAFYRIKPKNLTSEVMLNLRLYLERKIQGLSYNIMRERSGLYLKGISMSNTIFHIYTELRKQYPYIHRYLEDIKENPIQDIEKVYKEREGSVRPDNKSLRWLTKKGTTKNLHEAMPNVTYEKHSKLTKDTIENHWMIEIVSFLRKSLVKIEAIFIDGIFHSKRSINVKMNEIRKINEDISNSANNHIFKQHTSQQKEKRAGLEREINDLKENLKNLATSHGEVRKMMNTFIRYQEIPWVKTLLKHHEKPVKLTTRLIKNKKYVFMYRFYKDINHMLFKKPSFAESSFPHKKTSKLFEYYSLLLVIDVLNQYGYRWTSGWIADYTNQSLKIGDLRENTILKFEKNDHYIEVAFDTEIERLSTDITYSRFIDSSGRRPDIRLTAFNHNGVILDNKGSVIIEVKCRPYRKLTDSRRTTDVMNQLISYMNLEYYDKAKEDTIHPVDKVIVFYPKENREGLSPVEKDPMRKIYFHQIEPIDPDHEETPFGYESITKQLNIFLDRFQQIDSQEVN